MRFAIYIMIFFVLAFFDPSVSIAADIYEMIKVKMISELDENFKRYGVSIKEIYIKNKEMISDLKADDIVDIDIYNSEKVSRRYIVAVKVSDNKKEKKVLLPVSIDLEAAFIIAKNHIKKGDKIDADDIEKVKKVVSDYNIVSRAYHDDLSGKFAKKDIRQGSVILKESLETAKLIKAGEIVRLIMVGSNVSVTKNVMARTDGYIGDTVILDSDGRSIKAEVIADKMASIKF